MSTPDATTLSGLAFALALNEIASNDGGRDWPHGIKPGTTISDSGEYSERQTPITKEQWEAYQYNPPGSALNMYPDPDASPDVRPKPTWAELMRASRLARTRELFDVRALRALEQPTRAVANALFVHPLGSSPVQVDNGINHMGAMIHHRAESMRAGDLWPAAIVRDIAGNELTLWEETEALDFIGPHWRNKNRAESASNIVRARLDALKRTAEDENGGLDASESQSDKDDARVAAADQWHAMVADIQPHFDAALARFDAHTDDLPKELGRARKVLQGRLEAAATGAQKGLKGALTQQAIDNWAACVDMDKALREVAKRCVLASIEIDRAATASEAKAAHAAGVAAIEAVTAANTPHWRVGDTDLAQPYPPAQEVAGRSVTIRARHPQGTSIDGRVSISGWAGRDAKGIRIPSSAAVSSVPADDAKAHQIAIKLPDAVALPVDVVVRARNLCGPAELKVRMVEPKS